MASDRSAGDWEGRELQSAPQRWTYVLSDAERDEARSALVRAASSSRPTTEWTPSDLGLDALRDAGRNWRNMLNRGLGFVLIKSVPIEGYPEEAVRALYWSIGQMLGSAVPQNVAGDLICNIRDTGADPHNPNTRLYTTRAEQDFHTDAADIIGLLCLKPRRAVASAALSVQ